MEKELSFIPYHGSGRDIDGFKKSLEDCRGFLEESCWDLQDFIGSEIPILDADPWQSNGGILRPIVKKDEKIFHYSGKIPLYLRYHFGHNGGFLYCIFISPRIGRYAN